MTPRRFIFFAVLLLVLVASGFLFPCVGLSLRSHEPEIFWKIYWLRFHRTALALTAGGGLALAGLVFQAMFRNPLATPYTLGVASGAAFGAALCLQTTVLLPVSFGAFLGAFMAMGIVLALSRQRDTSTEQMLLAGVAVNFLFSSLIVLVQYLSDPYGALKILHWTMGGVHNAINASAWSQLLPIVLLFMLFLMTQSRTMNVFVTGNDRAKSLGVRVERFRMILFIVTSLVVGAIVSATGPIGFVGLIVPHVARLLSGPDHRLLIVTTGFMGAIFLAACDTSGRWWFSPTELPVGIVTSLLGAPFFLWLLLKRK